MDFKKLMLSSLLALSTSLHAQDQIGWGQVPGQPGQQQPSRPQQPSQPQQPSRPQQPSQPQQPSRPEQPSQPQQPSRPQQPSQPQQPSRPQQPNYPQQPSRPEYPSQPQYPSYPSYPSQPQAPVGSNDPWGHDQYGSREVELQLRQYFQDQALLNLLQDSYTRSQLQGESISYVTITASSESGYGQARLLVNGQALEQYKTVARQTAEYTFRVDSSVNYLRALELDMRGRFYVEKVVFTLGQSSGPSYPGPSLPSGPQVEVVRQQINQSIQDEGGLQLYRLFNLAAQRQGQSIRRITVLARSMRGGAYAQLKINGQTTGMTQNIGSYSTSLAFDLGGQRIGREIQDLGLYFRGNIIIDEVSIEFSR